MDTFSFNDAQVPADFNTKLSSEDETKFQAWKQTYAPKDSGDDYDLRGAYKAGLTPADNGHWPDTYKKPNHPTFSDQSIYAGYGNPGKWEGDKYIPGTKEKTSFGFNDAKGEQDTLTQGDVVGDVKNFVKEAATSVGNVLGDIVDKPAEAVGTTLKNLTEMPFGFTEAAADVVAGMGVSAGAGIRGVWNAVMPEAAGGGSSKKTYLENFQEGLDSVLGAASNLPIHAESETGKFLESALGLVPEGIHVLGNTVFEKTGSALAGAGTEGLVTLLTLKPDAATAVVKPLFGKSTPAGKQFTEAFDKMAEDEPWNARMTADKMTDKQLRADLNKRIDEILVKKQDLSDIMKSIKSPNEVTATDVRKIFDKDKLERTPEPEVATEDTSIGSNGKPEPTLGDGEVIIRGPNGDRREPTLPKEPEPDLGAEIKKIEQHLERNKTADEATARQGMAATIQQSAALSEAAGPYTELSSGREVWKLPGAKESQNQMTAAFLEAAQSKGYQSARFKQQGILNIDDIDKLARQTLAVFDRLPDLARLNVGTIRDTLRQQDIRQPERELVESVLKDMGDPKQVDSKEFAARVGEKLTPVYLSEHNKGEYADYGMSRIGYNKTSPRMMSDAEHSMTPQRTGSMAAPETHVWETPVQNAGASNHFHNPNYMAHARVMDQPGKVRSIIEVQSDLFQHTKELSHEDRASVERAIRAVEDADKLHQEELLKFTDDGRGNASTVLSGHEKTAMLPDDVADRLNNAIAAIGHETGDDMLMFEPGEHSYGDLELSRSDLNRFKSELSARLGNRLPETLTPLAKHWYERVLREENALAARDGVKTMRIATADTVAKVEGWPTREKSLADLDKKIEIAKANLELSTANPERYSSHNQGYHRNLERYTADRDMLLRLDPSGPSMPEHRGIYNRYQRELEPFVKKEFGAKETTDKQGNTWLEWTVDPKSAEQRVHVFGGTKTPTRNTGAGTLNSGIPLTPENIVKAFTFTREMLRKIPQYRTFEKEIGTSIDQAIRAVNPEALGENAKKAASIIAKAVSEQMQKDSSFTTRSQTRRAFWESSKGQSDQFIERYERGQQQPTREMQRAAQGYRQWNDEILAQDKSNGLKYDAQDNYLYHVFKDGKGVAAFMQKRYGSKWNDPNFIKDRAFDLYSEAKAHGFEAKFTNPEDIMLLRQHASDVAQMRVQALNDMEMYGVARRVVKSERPEVGEVEWRSPNGTRYWVQPDAAQVLHNAFNTKSLWNLPGVVGSAFRTGMWLKNVIVPVKLALSAFHPLHVATIDNATSMVRATKGLIAGSETPAAWMKGMLEGVFYKDLVKETGSSAAGPWKQNPQGGYRLLNVWKGKVPESKLTAADRQSLQYMTEGGFVPEMAAQYKNSSIQKLQDAVRARSVGSVFHLPFAMLEALNKPMFEVWIPSLKIASYLKDVGTALKADPSLAGDVMKRQLAMRAIAKSVDNRYGEMAYNTLFWNRWVKDIAVGSSLSLGWNLGFLREYGGAGLDIAGELARGSSLKEAAIRGKLDRALFVGFYSAQAMAYGGLLTWALTGQPPTSLLDYIYPKSGEKNPDGTDARLNTMFYPREFASIGLHMQREGVSSGLGHLVLNKASPVLGLANDWATNVDYFGKEISDPSAPAYKQLQQKLAYTFKELEPMSMAASTRANLQGGKKALPYLGFSPAPSYVTESNVQAAVKAAYRKYAKATTPFERAEFGEDATKLHNAIRNQDHTAYRETLLKMKEQYHLSPEQIVTLRKGSSVDPTLKMFKALPAEVQTRLLRDMSEEDAKPYLRQAQGKVRHGYMLRKAQ